MEPTLSTDRRRNGGELKTEIGIRERATKKQGT